MRRTVCNLTLPVCQRYFAPLYQLITAQSARSLFVGRSVFTFLFTYVIVSPLLQPEMCIGPCDNIDLFFDEHYVPSDGFDPSPVGSVPATQLKILLANARGLTQAAGEFKKRAIESSPHLIAVTEAHLLKDATYGLLSTGYTLVCRLDRTKHGGGLV